MAAERRRRVIVGVDGSLPSLRALRLAVDQATRRQADLTVIHIRAPARTNAQAALIGLPDLTPWPGEQTIRSLDREAEALIARCIDESLGSEPAGVAVRLVVDVGIPQICLVHQTGHDEDLLVVGTRGGRRWTHPWRRSVSRYCTTHAHCPVLVVPPDSFARAMRRAGWRSCWSPWRRDLWKKFDHQVGDDRQHVSGS
jgi:nucleotide-binding universal stress UspA family protein